MDDLRRARRAPLPVRATAAGAALAALLGLSGCGAGSDGGDAGGRFRGSGAIGTVPAGERRAAPDLSGETLDGGRLDFADYKGKVVVVNLWGSQCGPCRAETANLVKVAKDTRSAGVRFVGISRDASREAAEKFEKEYGVPYPSLHDQMGRIALRFPKGSINPQSIPATVFIDRKGRIAARALTPLTEAKLRETLKPLIAERA